MKFIDRVKETWDMLWATSDEPKEKEVRPYAYTLYKSASECTRDELLHKLIEIINDTHAELELPPYEIEALARCFLPDIIAFFESDEGKKEFEEWKKQREKNHAEEDKQKHSF